MTDDRPSSELTDEERLARCIHSGESAYTEMYDSLFPTGHYSNAKEHYRDAIALAHKLGLAERATELEERLAHIKAVFRSQFS